MAMPFLHKKARKKRALAFVFESDW